MNTLKKSWSRHESNKCLAHLSELKGSGSVCMVECKVWITSLRQKTKLIDHLITSTRNWISVYMINLFDCGSLGYLGHCLQSKKDHELVLPCLSRRVSRSLYPFFFTWIFTPKTRRRDSSILKYLLPRITVGLKFSGHGLRLGESSISLISKHPLILYISWHYFIQRFHPTTVS